jgi:hydrogenase assembly chaperone HypC/HupF
MCLARPVRVLKCDGEWVEVEDHDGSHRAYAALLSNKEVGVGDYLLVHGELAIHKLPEDEALKILELIDTL